MLLRRRIHMCLRSSKIPLREPQRRKKPCSRKRRNKPEYVGYPCLSTGHFPNSLFPPHRCAITYLKNYHGKYVKLSTKNGVKLVATDVPDGAITRNLEIWKKDDNIAFCFKYDENNNYVATVSENKLQLEPLSKTSDSEIKEAISPSKYWFQMSNVGNHHYCIRPVDCEKYLTIKNKCVTLSDTRAVDNTFVTPPCHCSERGCPGV